MSKLQGDRGIFTTRVVRRRELCREHFQLTLNAQGFPDAVPGQFLQILCRPPTTSKHSIRLEDEIVGQNAAANAPMLRRPFSIAGLRRIGAQREIDIMGRVIGVGTAWLDACRPDDEVEILGPLGHGFSLPPSGQRALLVAGGVGLPPVQWLAETLWHDDIPGDAIYGARTRDLLPVTLNREPSKEGALTPCVEEFARHNIAAMITTEDGSCGLKGRVTEGMLRYFTQLGDASRICVYACGPEPLLKATAAMCQLHGAGCQVAMERVMGCGMGTCQSCVVPVLDETSDQQWRYALCCTEGPVFDASRIRW